MSQSSLSPLKNKTLKLGLNKLKKKSATKLSVGSAILFNLVN